MNTMSNKSTETTLQEGVAEFNAENPPKVPMRLLWMLFPLIVMSVMELGIALPIIPRTGEFFGATNKEIGLLYSIQYMGQFVTAPLWGWLSDRFGRKPILMLALFTGALAEILTACATNLTILMIGRLFVGLTAGNIAIASAMISDMTTEKERSKGMAIIGISFAIGFVLGPLLGGYSGKLGGAQMSGMFHLGLPFTVAAIVLFLATVLAYYIVPSPSLYEHITEWNHKLASHRAETQNKKDNATKDRFPFYSAVLMCALYFFYTVSLSIIETRLSPLLKHQFSLDPGDIGKTFTGIALVLLIMQGSVSRLGKFIKDYWLILIGGLIAGLGYILSSTSNTYGFFFSMICLAAVGRGLFYPGLLSQTSKCYDSPKLTGQLMGFFNSFGAMGRISGPLLAGYIADQFIDQPYLPFRIGGISITAVIIFWAIFWIIAKKMTKTSAH